MGIRKTLTALAIGATVITVVGCRQQGGQEDSAAVQIPASVAEQQAQPTGAMNVPAQAAAQCAKDTDCKGDRVCDQGQCKAPVAATPAALGTQPAAAANPAAASDASLCTVDEKVLFACSTSKGKLASLCASPDLNVATGTIHYRFGTAGKPELTYPTASYHPREEFMYGNLMYSGGGGAYLQFSSGDYQYTVYSGIGRGWDKQGVAVNKSGRLVANLPCDNVTVNELESGYFEELGVPEDTEASFEIP